MNDLMCRPSPEESLKTKIRSDFKHTYFRLTVGYVAVMATLIFVAQLFDWRL